MSKRYSGKSFKDSSIMKKPKLTFKEKRKLKEENKKKRWKNGSGKDSSDLILLYFALYNKYNLLVYQLNVTNKKVIKNGTM